MKKLLSLLLALMLLFSFAACNSQKEENPQTEPMTTEPEETLPEEGNKVGNLCYGDTLPIVNKDGETGETIDPTNCDIIEILKNLL